jgi:hypothetical protein
MQPVMVDNTDDHTNKSTKMTTTNEMAKLQHTIQSEWAIDCFLTPNEQCVGYIIVIISYIRWDYVRFVLDQYALLNLYSATALKQQSLGRHIVPLGYIILFPSQPVFVPTPWCHMLSHFYSLLFDPTENLGIEAQWR